MFSAVFGSVEQGIIYAIMALGVYLTFRVLDFPDLTVDGSFVTGAAVAATMIVFGYHPLVATVSGDCSWLYCRLFNGFVTYKRKDKSTVSGNINDDCLVFHQFKNYGSDV